MIPKLKYFCLMILMFKVIHANSQEEVKESIKSIIENADHRPMIIDTQIIYCKQLLIDFYKNRTYEPAWNNNSNVKALTKELTKADEEGLNPTDYHIEKIIQLTKNGSRSTKDDVTLDFLLTDAFLIYTLHMRHGKIDQDTKTPRWKATTKENYLITLLQKSILSNVLQSSIENSKPKHEIYLDLKKALQKYTAYKEDGGWQSIPQVKLLKLGMKDSSVALIRKRLYATRDLPKRFLNNSNTYDKKLLEAVKKFQQRHRLASSGELSKETLRSMNVSIDKRIDQIKVNLERWRWYAPKLKSFYILVNIPDFSLEVIKNDKRERKHKVIVGRKDRKTPVFSSKITNLIFNPTWTVPPGILRKDILPSVRKNRSYLKNKNIDIYNDKGTKLNPSTVNFYNSTATSYSYIQSPGPSNVLGAVKFIFPNVYTVYLHDTSNKELFAKSERTFSSGCIRVQNPIELAEYLLNDSKQWNIERINSLVDTKKTQTVPLTYQPEIHVLYWTVWVDHAGIIQFRNDIYNKDSRVKKVLLKLPPYSK